MTREEFDFTIETAHGKPLRDYKIMVNGALLTIINAKTGFDGFDNIDEVKTKGEYPSEKEILNFVNAKRKQAARAAATTEELKNAGVEKPTLETSPEMRYTTIVKALVAGGLDEKSAKQQASALTNYNEAA